MFQIPMVLTYMSIYKTIQRIVPGDITFNGETNSTAEIIQPRYISETENDSQKK